MYNVNFVFVFMLQNKLRFCANTLKIVALADAWYKTTSHHDTLVHLLAISL